MDNRSKDFFFQLLRIGLWGKGTLELTAALSDQDWMMDEIFYSDNFGYHDDRYKDGAFSPLSA